jgi:hypothetical protein
MSFVPPLFKNFGKSAKDLFSKKYDYQNKLSVKNSVQSDLTVETSTTSDEKNNLSGSVKVTHKNKDFGKVEVEVDTKGAASAETTLSKLAKNVEVIVKVSEKPNGKATVEYKQDGVAASVAVDYSKSATKAEGSVAAGLDGFAVGGEGTYDFTKSDVAIYNAGAEYAGKEFYATVKTANKFDKVAGSYFHNINTGRAFKTQVGGTFEHDFAKKASVLSIGTEHEVDAATLVKGKLDSEGAYAAVVEHKLANPAVKINVAAGFNRSSGLAAQSFGVGFAFGEF